MAALLLGALAYANVDGNPLKIEGIELSFLSRAELLAPAQKKPEPKAEVSAILAKAEESENADAIADSAITAEPEQDTLLVNFIQDASDRLMAQFFGKLKAARDNALIRIAYFGDSQIEADRFSSILRQRLQRQFGGCGTGLLPIFEPSDVATKLSLQHSGTWRKYGPYGGLARLPKDRYGPLMSSFRYLRVLDSMGKPVDSIPHGGWISFTPPKAPLNLECSLLYAAASSTRIRVNGKPDTLSAGGIEEFNRHPLSIESGKKVRVDFSGASPDFYGLDFSCANGVTVDNVPMRGSAGTDFVKSDVQRMARQLRALNTQLIIMQYGANVVPYVSTRKQLEWFHSQFLKNLKALRQALPEVPIIVIGLGDMAKKAGTEMQSYPMIEQIRDAQRDAAAEAGCVFWDLYRAMGGRNSMVLWHDAQPALAEADYTHFTWRGAQLAGNLFYDALMRAYAGQQMEK